MSSLSSHTQQKKNRPDIAIIGIGTLFPESSNATLFWKNILGGKDLISDVPPSHWLLEDYYDPDPSTPDKTYGKRGGFLEDMPFDPIEWGIPPNIIPATDTTQLLALIVAKMCLQSAANGDFSHMDRSKMSVILGVTSAQELYGHMVSRLQRPVWQKVLRENGLHEQQVQEICDGISNEYQPWQENTFPGLLGNVVAGRIANRLDFGGTNCITDAACASSFSAISMAVNELYLGDSDLVLAGGADTMNDILMHMCFSKTPALSKSGDCRPFSDKADGTLLGEGIAMFAFKRLEDAERDGDNIYALLKSVGSSSDGRSKSIYAPLSEGQSKAIIRAYERAGFGAESVEMVEAHGTGTKAGDAAEFGGLKIGYGLGEEQRQHLQSTYTKQWCALGSVKSQIGHSKATAGAAGLFKAVMSLHQGILPPTIKVDRPNPALDIGQTPFYLNTETRPWIRSDDHPRRAGVSSFGFGGSNFHIALEEYIPSSKGIEQNDKKAQKAQRLRSASHELFLFSASTPQELIEKLQSEYLAKLDINNLAWLAQQSLTEFSVEHPCRASVICSTLSQIENQIKSLVAHLQKTPQNSLQTPNGTNYVNEPSSVEGKIALLFPGQGSQYVGMSRGISCIWEEARSAWDDSLTHLSHLGLSSENELRNMPLHRVVFPVPVFDEKDKNDQQAHLTKTQWAQPAIGTCSLSIYRLLSKLGLNADMVAGHSYGEVTALHVAGAMDTKTFFQISRKRGELMAHAAASTPGSMSAVKKNPTKLQDLLKDWNEALGTDVVVANHNSPVQSVISGSTQDIEKIEQKCSEEGLTAQRLGVSTAFHSKIVASAVPEFADFLETCSFQTPNIPVYANTTADVYQDDTAFIRSTLSNQIASSVLFVDEIEKMHANGAKIFIEVGPKNTLSKLTKRILRKKKIHTFQTDMIGKEGIFGMLSSLAAMAIAGLPLSYSKLWEGFECFHLDEWQSKKSAKGKKASALSIPLNGSNYKKPYPPKGGAAVLPKPNWDVPVAKKTAEHHSNISEPKPSKAIKMQPQKSETIVPKQVNQRRTPMSQNQSKPPATVSSGWLAAFQAAQQQTAQAHIAYQQAMSQAHIAYLQAAQGAFAGLSGVSLPNVTVPQQPTTPVVSQPVYTPPTIQQEAPIYQQPPVQPQPQRQPQKQPQRQVEPIVHSPAPVVSPSLNISKETSDSDINVSALLLEVVSEKTGYPTDTLSMEMTLEADLGIDSIKRVEILSTMQERAPSLPEVDGSSMATLQTLGEIVAFLGEDPAGNVSTTKSSNGIDITGLLLEVVSEKTGYPTDTLNMEMTLEADLGIDSIKRVEILSTMQERAPSLPEVDGSSMATLQTLGEIVGFMSPTDATQEEASNSVNFTKAELSTDNSATTAPSATVELVLSPLTDIRHSLYNSFISDVVVLGEGSFAQQMRSKLEQNGVSVLSKESLGESCFSVIDLRPLELIWYPQSSSPEMEQRASKMSKEIFLTAQKLAHHENSLFIVVQSNNAFGKSTHNAKNVKTTAKISALASGVAGVVRSASVEWSNSICKNIDIDSSLSEQSVVDTILQEVLQGAPQTDVAYIQEDTGVQRYTLHQSLQQIQELDSSALSKSDIFVISGGARGVTAECVVELARRVPAKFVLVGRSSIQDDPVPGVESSKIIASLLTNKIVAGPKEARKLAKSIQATREILRNVERLKSLGATVKYVSVDITDKKLLSLELEKVRQDWGPITGIVHGAGVLADKEIAKKPVKDFEWVFDVKIEGMKTLLECTQSDPLTYLVYFSSVAARFGNRGQCDYAAANEVLNKMAIYEKRKRDQSSTPLQVVRSIGWGPWDGGMVTPSLRKHFQSMGVSLISLTDGAKTFANLMSPTYKEVEWIVGKGESIAGQNTLPTWSIQLDAKKHNYLLDHQIRGKVVIPIAQVVLWIKHSIQSWCRDNFVHDEQILIENLKVLRGLSFDASDVFNQKIEISAQQISATNFEIVVGHKNTVTLPQNRAYSCQVHIGENQIEPVSHSALTHTFWKNNLQESVETKEKVYQSPVLFHQKSFQMIQSVAFSQTDECLGVFTAESEVMSVDASLQLALLWSEQKMRKATVPMSIESFVLSRPEDIVSCVLLGKGIFGAKARSEAYFLDKEHEVCGIVRGIETVAFS